MLFNFKALHQSYKVDLQGRFVSNTMLKSVLDNCAELTKYERIGYSVNNKDIYGIKLGNGPRKVLLWSQMHGNETTTTKALLDLVALLLQSHLYAELLNSCTLFVIPILNPDGAENYSRYNANNIDLNRDAQLLSQPESKTLRDIYNTFNPDYCFNLHGQRSIYGVGFTRQSSCISFLSPSVDADKSLTSSRKKSMAVIAAIVKFFDTKFQKNIGRYNDTFNANCVGDTFQQLGAATLLFEAGHFPNDYQREVSRFYIFKALIFALQYIANPRNEWNWKPYFEILENKKNFCDILIRSAIIHKNQDNPVDIAIQFKEHLQDKTITFIPVVEKIGHLSHFNGHKSIEAKNEKLTKSNLLPLQVGDEIDFVMLKNRKILLKP